jgi:uncharacterized protein (DUF2384 family)
MAVARPTPARIPDVIRTLGGPELVHARSLEQLRERLRAGLPFASLAAVASGFGLAGEDASAVLRIPARTLARRKRERRLARGMDRLYRLGRTPRSPRRCWGRRKAAQRLARQSR